MQSFSKIVKQEIMLKKFSDASKQVILLAIIKLLISFENKPFKVYLESSDYKMISFIKDLLKDVYNLSLLIMTFKKVSFQKQIIIYCLDLTSHMDLILNNKEISYLHLANRIIINYDLILKNEVTKRAFIAGAFIATGSVNSPQISNYHLEIQSDDFEFIKFLQKQINSFGFKFKRIYRRKKPLIYLKKSSEISDFLKLIDARNAVLSFENERISRDMYNSINRLTNIEISNQQKTNKAAKEQIKMIDFLKKHRYFSRLSLKSQQVANLRLENHEASLSELCELYDERYHLVISKSGINHIMREIKEKYLIAYDIFHHS